MCSYTSTAETNVFIKKYPYHIQFTLIIFYFIFLSYRDLYLNNVT